MGLDRTQPKFRIVANSIDVTAVIADRLISLRLTDEAGVDSDTLEIVLADDQPDAPIEKPAKGAELEVFLGYETAATRMGLFVADEIEMSGWPGEMVIRSRAAPYDKSRGGKSDLQTHKSRNWADGTKLGDMVAKIAKEHGMEPAVSAGLRAITLPHFDQTEESDISFLVRIAKRYDAIAKPAGGKLVLAKRGEGKTVGGEDLPTITVTPTDEVTWRVVEASRESAGTVVAYYHAKGAAKKTEVVVGDGEPVKRLRHYYPTEDAAKRAAKAELDRSARGMSTLSLSVPGDPALCAECKLSLIGFRAGVPVEWIVTRVVHELDAGSGYRVSIEAELPN
jgi:phage protein D